MKSLICICLLFFTIISCTAQTEIVYKADSLKIGNKKEKKTCQIIFKYDVNKRLSSVVIKYANKKNKDWAFEVIKPINYYWNCEEYHATTSGMDCMIGICTDLNKNQSFIVCTEIGAKMEDCMKYIILKK